MAGYNGSGVWSFTYNWANDAANNVPITASRMDTQFADATGGFNNVLTRDGQGIATANLPMGGFKHTGAGNATAAGQYIVYGQNPNALGGSATAMTWTDSSGAGLTLTTVYGAYVTIGPMTTVWGAVTYPATASGSSAIISGLPIACVNATGAGGAFSVWGGSTDYGRVTPNSTSFSIFRSDNVARANAAYSGLTIYFQFSYPTS